MGRPYQGPICIKHFQHIRIETDNIETLHLSMYFLICATMSLFCLKSSVHSLKNVLTPLGLLFFFKLPERIQKAGAFVLLPNADIAMMFACNCQHSA